jgi:GDP-L-fucose synthase
MSKNDHWLPFDWQSKHVIVTGGAGFLGQHLVTGLKARGLSNQQITVPRSADYDLRRQEAVEQLFADVQRKIGPASSMHSVIVVHLAGNVGGIGYNREKPGELFYDNTIMGVQLIDTARRYGVGKFVIVGTICAYPKFTPIPFREEELWNGYPEETNAPYGLAKKMLLVQAQAYRQQYDFNAIYLLPVNLYGPVDNFNPASSHVIPALIKKCMDAQKEGHEITAWGDGSPTREFLYAPDAAEGILLATERYNGPEPVNLGSAHEISIKDLLQIIAQLTGFTGNIVWDRNKPNGQPRRKLNTERAEKLFGFSAQTDFKEGLRQTISWYREFTDQ